MKAHILLVSGIFPRYLSHYRMSLSGNMEIVTTSQESEALELNDTQAQTELLKVLPSWPLAQISYVVGE